MKFYSKSVFPKEVVEGNSEHIKIIKEAIAERLGSAISDYITFEENDDCIHYPESQDKHGWSKEYVGSVDISIPTKLMPMGGGSGHTYVCQNCFSNNNIPRTYWFSDRVPKYCDCCGAHFTNIVRDSELPVYFIKREEDDDDKVD